MIIVVLNSKTFFSGCGSRDAARYDINISEEDAITDFWLDGENLNG